ncbi:MAG TPA: CAP domain-containing protein [Gaiellaceae bacterium]|nr:CAP domain-containing protein [Gaiellaceae bacterium]
MARPRLAVAFLLAALASLAALAPAASPATGSRQTTSLSVDLGVLDQLNQIRTAHGVAQLRLSSSLTAAATAHSRDMLAKGYFAHDSADGQPFWKRILAYYPAGRFGYWSVGENLFWTSGPGTAAAGVRAWMASPEHRSNILDPAWRQIGIAAVSSTDAPGTFDHRAVTVITTDFGVRRER